MIFATKSRARHRTVVWVLASGRCSGILRVVKPIPLASAIILALLSSLPAHAEPAQLPTSSLNMPPGWQWPPTDAMRESGDRCLAALSSAGVDYRRTARPLGKIVTPVVVPSMVFAGLRIEQVHATRRAAVMDCHMALTLAQHAPLLSELGIRSLIVAGFYQNRRARLRGRSVELLSRHALGLAVDIRALVTREGETLSVRHNYRHPLFGRLEDALTEHGQLRAVVSPRNDPAHRGHLHISAKMTIDATQPDPSVDIAELLLQTRRIRASRRLSAQTTSARLQPRSL